MILRSNYLEKISSQFRIHNVCALLGPRQCGKTTLAKYYATTFVGKCTHFDLENPEDLEALSIPLRTLEKIEGLVIIDEIQRLPNLFPILRVLADKKQAHYLILGSASRDLIQQSSETLAGRIGYIELTPFSIYEGCQESSLIVRGGFPNSYLALSDEDSFKWRKAYIRTFLERDIPALGFRISPLMLQRFWMMLSHYHGQILNKEQLGKSLSVTGHTISHYLDILSGTFMIRILSPWFENTTKRQIKTPKIYLRDSGIMNSLCRIENETDMITHPMKGAIWEGFALEEIVKHLQVDSEECFFWRTQNGAEIDLLIFKKGKRYGFEFKFVDAPKITKSMHIAFQDLNLEHIFVIYPGYREISMSENITGIGLDLFIKETFRFIAI